MIRRVPVGLVAIKDARPRSRSSRVRSLQLESLESRHTFCADLTELAALTAPAAVDSHGEGELAAAPFYGPMPADYYAQFPEWPAQISSTPNNVVAAPTQTPMPAVIDEALRTLDDPTDEGEGEAGCDGTYSVSRGKAPRIVRFTSEQGFFGGIFVVGKVADDDGPVSSLPVNFYGALDGRSTMTTQDGLFSLYIPRSELPRGLAQAQVTDLDGNKSESVERLF